MVQRAGRPVRPEPPVRPAPRPLRHPLRHQRQRRPVRGQAEVGARRRAGARAAARRRRRGAHHRLLARLRDRRQSRASRACATTRRCLSERATDAPRRVLPSPGRPGTRRAPARGPALGRRGDARPHRRRRRGPARLPDARGGHAPVRRCSSATPTGARASTSTPGCRCASLSRRETRRLLAEILQARRARARMR